MGRFKDLHVLLPADTARSVDRLARDRGLKKADVLRQAVERYVDQARRETRDQELRAYVEKMAAHSGEFVKETGPAVRKMILEETEW